MQCLTIITQGICWDRKWSCSFMIWVTTSSWGRVMCVSVSAAFLHTRPRLPAGSWADISCCSGGVFFELHYAWSSMSLTSQPFNNSKKRKMISTSFRVEFYSCFPQRGLLNYISHPFPGQHRDLSRRGRDVLERRVSPWVPAGRASLDPELWT